MDEKENEPKDVPELDPADLVIDTYGGSTSGFVAKPATGVRITHKPTGIQVSEDGERSQFRNKAAAYERLKLLVAAAGKSELLPCPFCGGPVKLEHTVNSREWWGVVCRNTINLGGTCAIQQIPSASKEAATERWNRRAPIEVKTDQGEAQVGVGDSALLDFLDTNARFKMGWAVKAAPVGNLSVQSIIRGGTPIREAIRAAMSMPPPAGGKEPDQ